MAVVESAAAASVLQVMRRHPKGREAAIVGRVTKEHACLVVARTALGANRVIPMQIGEQLPRIC